MAVLEWLQAFKKLHLDDEDEPRRAKLSESVLEVALLGKATLSNDTAYIPSMFQDCGILKFWFACSIAVYRHSLVDINSLSNDLRWRLIQDKAVCRILISRSTKFLTTC